MARRMAERKTTIPVYSFAKLDASIDWVGIAATDGESALLTRCEAEIAEPGSALASVKTLHEMAKAATADGFRLRLEKGRLRVTCGSFSAVLQTLPVVEYPLLPSMPESTVELPGAVLQSAIARVRFVVETAASGRPSDKYMHGALLELKPGHLRMVATDGRRMACVTHQATGLTVTDTALVPRKALDDLAALLDSGSGDEAVRFAHDGSKAFFALGDRLLVSHLIDAKFPNYDRIIPKSKGFSADVDRDAWLGALKRVGLASGPTTTKVRLDFQPSKLVASTSSVEVGDASEDTPMDLHGDAWSAGFESAYLSDFLRAAPAGIVAIEQLSDVAPAALRAGDDYLYILSPMSI